MKAFASVALVAAMIAPPCLADPFCDGIHKAAAGVSAGFDGMYVDGGFGGTVKPKYRISGAHAVTLGEKTHEACEVFLFMTTQKPRFFCQFPAANDAAGAADAMAPRVAACLGLAVPAAGDVQTNGGAHFYRFDQGGVAYEVVGLGFPDGARTLELDITDPSTMDAVEADYAN